MPHVTRELIFSSQEVQLESCAVIDKEWLIANGLGGYSSMSILGNPLRKYHGLLVSAFPSPLGRIITFNYLEDVIRTKEGKELTLSPIDLYEEKTPPLTPPLTEFRLEDGLPIWTYSFDGILLEKRILMPHMQNTVLVMYRLLKSSAPIELILRPFFHFRHHESSPQTTYPHKILSVRPKEHMIEIRIEGLPPLYLQGTQAKWNLEEKKISNVRYRYEEERGYDSKGDLLSSGFFSIHLKEGEDTTLTVSSEPEPVVESTSQVNALEIEQNRRNLLFDTALKKHPELLKHPFAIEMIFAADQFVITPISRLGDIAMTKAHGQEARTIIAGYHWFTDWGRDIMISLEGLMLSTGRISEARYTLHTYAQHIKDGLIPNMFPDGSNEGRYNTADATLWFFHAIERYLAYSQDFQLVKDLLPRLKEIVHRHLHGTHFGIHVDSSDGLLKQGEDGYALTWMDAVFKDLVITPRRGKAVEINALWFNALSLLIEWMEKLDDIEDLTHFRKLKEQCQESFNEKFWNKETQYLYDIIDGPNGKDPACRPNQLLAISLKHPVLKKRHWESVINAVQAKLLTPFGLRTLSPEHIDYKVVYKGNLFLRDSAYHQGTVWPWLMGPFIDAWLKVYPDKKQEALKFLNPFEKHGNEAGIGYINEIFDAETPFVHRGCIAQAWSVGEILRSIIKVSS